MRRWPVPAHRQCAPPWQAALERLAAWALQWSSHVHPGAEVGGTPTLWLELGASLNLFGGLAPLLTRLRTALDPLSYSTRCGVAPTPAGAALLARAGEAGPETTLEGLRRRLAPLPLGLLALPPATLAACESAGIRRIGTLLALPDAAIARRFGPAASRYLQQLTGRAPEPLPASAATRSLARALRVPEPRGSHHRAAVPAAAAAA
jgi:protein ImuB